MRKKKAAMRRTEKRMMKSIGLICLVSLFLFPSCSKRVELTTTNNTQETLNLKIPGQDSGFQYFRLKPAEVSVHSVTLLSGGLIAGSTSRPLTIEVLQPTNHLVTTNITTNVSGGQTFIFTNTTSTPLTVTSVGSVDYQSITPDSKKSAVITFFKTTNLSGFTYHIHKVEFAP